MPKIRVDLNDDELVAAYQSGLGLNRLQQRFSASRSGIAKRLRKLGVLQDRSPAKKERPLCERCGNPCKEVRSRFCSQSCTASIVNIGITRHGTPGKFQEKNCSVCGKKHKNPKFCSFSCMGIASRKPEEKVRERIRIQNLINVRKYQAKKLAQTPTDADPIKIKEFYTNCPPGYEVDHKIPISKGGFHHQDNLQYLLMSDNRRKSNKLDWTCDAERPKASDS